MPSGGGNGKGSRGEQDHPSLHGQTANGPPAADGAGQRGLDSGLAKAAPTADKLDQKSYRSYRRRLELYQKQCQRRGRNVAAERAFLCLSLLQDSAWEATEQLNIDGGGGGGESFSAAVRPPGPTLPVRAGC